MMGAAVLAAKACMRSGAGKLTAYIPKSGYVIMQVSVPEVMARISGTGDYIDSFLPVAVHESLGVGPGIGVTKENETLLKDILSAFQKPIVLDADALTVMAVNKSLLKTVPPHSILTPHPREFERLFGTSPNEMARIQQAKEMAAEYNVIILLKGHHSFIALPDGRGYFNNTGNAGMATAGSGDVLTGILTGLLAQGYSPAEAALLGVYLHGLAGDMAADSTSPEAMMAGDINDCLGEAFNTIHP